MKREMNARPRLVVVGGDAAGMSAASQARRRIGPEDLEIVALERGSHTSYSACGIPYLVGKTVPSPEDLIARTPEVFWRDHAIEARTGTEVTAIDTERREVTATGPGGAYTERYDRLVIATGARPRRPDLPGFDAYGVFGVQTLDDGTEVSAFLERHGPRRAVVVGGGYIGLEMAEAFLTRGLEVTVVDSGPEPMGTLDPDMGALVRGAMEEMGVAVRTGERATAVAVDGGRVSAVHTDTGGEYPADIVCLGLGVRPDSRLAEEAGLETGPTGGVKVDARMRTSVPGVWSAGDCVEVFHRVSRAPAAIALGTHANKQGRVAGIDIGGGYARFEGVVGTAVTKICAVEVARTGLNEAEAAAAGFAYETVVMTSDSRAGYYPGAQPMTLKLLAERDTGRLLGGQIVGRENAAKRVDVLATALWNGMDVLDMSGMDLGYAPPFSPVWDPVLIAARKLAERVHG